MAFFVSSGYRMFYHKSGEGRLVLILHGNTSSSAHHRGELAHFGKRFRAVAPDLFGCGKSDRAPRWPANWWRRAADDAAALVGHLGEKDAVVVGTSGGGVAALMMAIHHPRRVRAVIADSCVEKWTPDEIKRAIGDRSRLSAGQGAFWEKAHGEDWREVVRADSEMFLGLSESGANFYDDRLSEIKCPVLLTDSLADEMLPRTGEQVAKMCSEIPDCRAYLVSQGRHPMMWSRSEEWRRAADAFLESVAQMPKE